MTHHKILERAVRNLPLLLKSRHEPAPRAFPDLDLGERNRKQETEALGGGIADLDNLVPRPPNLGEHALLDLRRAGRRGSEQHLLLIISCGAAREVGLVLLALRVRQIRAFVDMQRQTQTALERAEVRAQNVGILGQVDRLERELAQAFAAVHGGFARAGEAAAALVRSRAVLLSAPP